MNVQGADTKTTILICEWKITTDLHFTSLRLTCCRSQWQRGLRRRSTATRLLRSWVRIPPRAWMFVCCECCVFSGRGLCDGLIIRSEESYRLWRVVLCDHETSQARRLKPARGPGEKNKYGCLNKYPLFRYSELTDWSCNGTTNLSVTHGLNPYVKCMWLLVFIKSENGMAQACTWVRVKDVIIILGMKIKSD
jgi:hypothetical protein